MTDIRSLIEDALREAFDQWMNAADHDVDGQPSLEQIQADALLALPGIVIVSSTMTPPWQGKAWDGTQPWAGQAVLDAWK